MALLPGMVLLLAISIHASDEFLMGGHLDNLGDAGPARSQEEVSVESSSKLADLDLIPEESADDPSVMMNEETRFRIPGTFVFNGGKPFSLEKDPITGKIDFEKAPPLKALDTIEYEGEEEEESYEKKNEDNTDKSYVKNKDTSEKYSVDNSARPNEINPYSPSFHDFLNLPVHYSSNKYNRNKYPMISNSYANTKIQSGSNSYSTYNHKPYEATSKPPLYFTTYETYLPRTTTTRPTTSTTTTRPTTSTTTTRPTTSTSPTTTTTQKQTTTTSTSSPVATWKPSTTTSRPSTSSNDDLKNRPVEPSRKSEPPRPEVSTSIGNSQLRPSVFPQEEELEYDDYDYEPEDDNREYSRVTDKTYVSSRPDVVPISSSSTTTVAPVTTTTPTTTTSTTMRIEPPIPSIDVKRNEMKNETLKIPMQTEPTVPKPLANLFSGASNPWRTPTYENANPRPEVSNNGVKPVKDPLPTVQNLHPGGPLYHPVESTSNVVVPPGQDMVSFVLGNLQNVDGGHYVGSAIRENLYGSGNQGSFRPSFTSSASNIAVTTGPNSNQLSKPAFQPKVPNGQQTLVQPQRKPQFPVQQQQTVIGTADGSWYSSNTVRNPQSDRRKEQEEDTSTKRPENSGYVIFPGRSEDRPIEEHIIVVNETDGSIREIPSANVHRDAVTVPEIIHDDGLPQLSESLTPPERPRPYEHRPRPSYQAVRPDYPRPPGQPSPSKLLETPGYKWPPADSKLPNILPQFRPNAKTSHGHRGSELIGTIPAQHGPHGKQPLLQRRPSSPLPPHLQRLSPPPPPIHAVRLSNEFEHRRPGPFMDKDALQVSEAGVKRLRGPSSSAHDERLQGGRLTEHKLRPKKQSEPSQMPPRPLLSNRRTDVPKIATLQMIQQLGGLEERIVKPNLPPPFRVNFEEEEEKVEAQDGADRNRQEYEENVENNDENDAENSRRRTVEQDGLRRPVYVVYPVNSAVNIQQDDSQIRDESVVVGIRGPHRPLPPDVLPSDDDEERDWVNNNNNNEKIDDLPILPPRRDSDEPLLRPHVTRPSSSSSSSGPPPIVSNFPYPLERPDPSLLSLERERPLLIPNDIRRTSSQYSTDNEENKEKTDDDSSKQEDVDDDEDRKRVYERRNEDRDTSVNVIPYLQDYAPFHAGKADVVISATLRRSTSSPSVTTPIAFVYTPTSRVDEYPILGADGTSSDRKSVLPSQQPSSSSSSAPSPQSFMAPFMASLSAEAPSKTDWSVVAKPEVKSVVDENAAKKVGTAEDPQMQKGEFDPENFKPQLFGGFKPIYEFPTEDETESPARRKEMET